MARRNAGTITGNGPNTTRCGETWKEKVMSGRKDKRTPEERKKIYEKILQLEKYGMQRGLIAERLGVSCNLIRQIKMAFKEAA
jgi:hypothetical protein